MVFANYFVNPSTLSIHVCKWEQKRLPSSKYSESSALMSNKSVTLRMPLDVTIDNNKYIVSGYPQYVKVKVTGPSALVTTTSNTQNFKVYADLSDLTPGKHRVKLKTSGLNSELTSKIEPQYINVNIQPRKTITMKVTIRLSTRDLDNGYKLGRPHSDIQTVQVTGSRDEVNKVNRIVAFVAIPHDAKDNIARQVTLQAIDRNGQTLNVVISQSSSSNDSSSSSSGSEESEEAKSNSRATSRNDSSDFSSETSQSSSSISNEDSSSSSRNQ